MRSLNIGKKNITDPYVVVYAAEKLNAYDYQISEIGRTSIKENTVHPTWNHKINFTPKNAHENTNYFYLLSTLIFPKIVKLIA